MRGLAGIDESILAPLPRNLTDKQQRFVEEYLLKGGKQGDAAVAAGYSPEHADNAAWRMMRNPLIQQAITRETLKRIGLRAASALHQVERLSEGARSEYVRLEASKDLLDRAGFKAPDRVDHRLDASLTVSFDIAPRTITETGASKTHDG